MFEGSLVVQKEAAMNTHNAVKGFHVACQLLIDSLDGEPALAEADHLLLTSHIRNVESAFVKTFVKDNSFDA